MNHTQPIIIFHHRQPANIGIQTVHYTRNVIGYLWQGTKLIHLGDRYISIHAGELFHLNQGIHYIENIPDNANPPFQQTLFFYTASDLRNVFTPDQSITTTQQLCTCCQNSTDVYTYPAWPLLIEFFHTIERLITSRLHLSSPQLEHLKLCELFQLLMAQPGCCISHAICNALTEQIPQLPEIMRANIMRNLSLQELSQLCGMSLSTFKNEFRRYFHTSPHKWLITQRLAHARLQLLTTQKSIATIAHESHFNTSSHFIKLFREQYGTTPAAYRERNHND